MGGGDGEESGREKGRGGWGRRGREDGGRDAKRRGEGSGEKRGNVKGLRGLVLEVNKIHYKIRLRYLLTN